MVENKCDELFGKNGELVEFRKKQVLEGAFGIIQRHYEGKPNKMEMVAAILGKRLNERFTVDRKGYRFQARFTEYGLDILGEWDNPYIDVNANVLQDLLTGEVEIIND